MPNILNQSLKNNATKKKKQKMINMLNFGDHIIKNKTPGKVVLVAHLNALFLPWKGYFWENKTLPEKWSQ